MANQSWRIGVSEINLSSIAIASVGNRGASVIRASQGPLKPVLISKGGKQRILNIFGKPSASYPDVWDIIEYNNTADIWVSAPSKSGLFGGVLVTKTGTVPLTSGLSSIGSYVNGVFVPSVDLALLPVQETLGTGDGSTTAFSITLTDKTFYNNQSINIKVNGVTINVSATNAATEVLTTNPNVGSGTYVRATGVLSFTFVTPPAMNAPITANYTTNRSNDVYFILFDVAPEADDTAVKISYNSTTNLFTLNTYQLDSTSLNYNPTSLSPYTVSLTPGAKDGFGQNVYISDVLSNDDYFVPVINTSLAVTTFVNDSANVALNGGYRGVAITNVELNLGWDFFQQSNTYPADIFFDCTADPTIPSTFSTLRNSYQKYKAYICPLPNSNSATAITNKQALSISDRGIYFYWNWGLVRNTYTGTPFWSALIGRVAKKHAAMVDVYNGLAPSWIDENGHGGQLGGGIIQLANDPSESDLQLLDTNQINPIIFDPNYGVMIVSDKTSITTLSDYSFIPHSRVADFIISNIVNNVLPFQLTKLNDTTHRSIVRSQAESIITPLLRAPYNLLRDAFVKCDEENNNDEILAQRKFILSCAIKFTPFSETIQLVFVNVEQSIDVREVF